MRQLQIDDVISLLRTQVKRAGGVVAWSAKTGIRRTTISKVLAGPRPPTKGIIRTLGLSIVFVVEDRQRK
jgi:DNA-binding phage protein